VAQLLPAAYVRDEHLSVLGAEFGEFYHALQNEVIWAYAKWLEYKNLYATSPDRVVLLNRAGPFLFRVVQDVLWNDILLHLARLTAPAESGAGNSNLTIMRLVGAVSDPYLASEMPQLIKNAEHLCKFARDWRKRHPVHRDFDLTPRGARAKALAPATRRHVDAALNALALVINQIEAHYFHDAISFERLSGPGDAEAFLAHLAGAASAREPGAR
jgi:hypothetical protein